MKLKCKCNNIATWEKHANDLTSFYYCDTCVPRGCSCNEDPITGIEDVDPDTGLLYPCCELTYCKYGIDEFDEYDYYKFCERENLLEVEFYGYY